MPNDPGLTGLFTELKRRRVFRTLAIYMAAAFVALQVTDLAMEPLELPDWTMKLLWILAIAGLPVVIGLAWAFDLPHGGAGQPPAAADAQPPASRHAADARAGSTGIFDRPVSTSVGRPATAFVAFVILIVLGSAVRASPHHA